jgi:hypothetical protein
VTLLLAGCAAPGAENQPPALPTQVETTAPALEPVITEAAVETSDLNPDVEPFVTALLAAITAQDTQKLETWIAEPFLNVGWGSDAVDEPRSLIISNLQTDWMVPGNPLQIVEDADLTALMRGIDPLSIPRPDAGVVETVLVSGFGKDGRDEAALYIARQPDNSLVWNGWIYFPSGISGVRYGGVQPYANPTYNYRFYFPKGFEVLDSLPENVMILAPGQAEPGQDRAYAIIMIEPANGRDVQQITDQVIADHGPGFNIPPGTALGLDTEMAIVLTGLSGQDSNRQLFMVHNDLLYRILFVPESPDLPAYGPMVDLYGAIVNSFDITD